MWQIGENTWGYRECLTIGQVLLIYCHNTVDRVQTNKTPRGNRPFLWDGACWVELRKGSFLLVKNMKPKSKKIEELSELKNKLPKFEIVVFTSFSKAGEKGLSVAQMTELKRLLRSLGSEYFVTKKTLIDLATK